jgi:hypothetical protein
MQEYTEELVVEVRKTKELEQQKALAHEKKDKRKRQDVQ